MPASVGGMKELRRLKGLPSCTCLAELPGVLCLLPLLNHIDLEEWKGNFVSGPPLPWRPLYKYTHDYI